MPVLSNDGPLGTPQAGAQWRQVAANVVDHQLVFVFVFGRAHQALAAEAILLRIVLTARRARQRIGVDLAALLADQQFRAGADQHAAIGQRRKSGSRSGSAPSGY